MDNEVAFSIMSKPCQLSSRIRWLHLCRGVLFILNEYPGYDTKPSGGKDLVLEIWRTWHAFSLPLLSSLPRIGAVVPVSNLYIGKMNNSIIYYTWNHFTVRRQMNNVEYLIKAKFSIATVYLLIFFTLSPGFLLTYTLL